MILKLLISLSVGLFLVYCLFCMFLACVGLPLEYNYNFKFTEEPKGFVKYSRIFGNIIVYGFVLLIITGIMYAILFIPN